MIDDVMSVLHASLNGLMTQQSAIADNIANVSTPGYKAKFVDFATALNAAVANGQTPAPDVATVTISNAPVNQIGNNVDINGETVKAANTSLEYQAVINAVNAKFALLRTAMS
jgi:flagellar basal-body rod protein FlgB